MPSVMRLINTDKLQLEEFVDSELPAYGIVSHTWGSHEATFEDFLKADRSKQGVNLAKIHAASQKAREDDLQYIWIDTCTAIEETHPTSQSGLVLMSQSYERRLH